MTQSQHLRRAGAFWTISLVLVCLASITETSCEQRAPAPKKGHYELVWPNGQDPKHPGWATAEHPHVGVWIEDK